METMTVLTKEIFQKTRTASSVAEAVDLLLNYEHFRTLGDVLRKFSPAPDLKQRLVAGLQVWFPEDKAASIDRKVRNWLNGKTLSVSKQDAYVVSRILRLTLEETNSFLSYAVGESIHWRSPEEIVWCYSIAQDLSPEQTRCLLERAKTVVSFEGKPGSSTGNAYTAEVFDKLQPVFSQDEDALLAFLKEEQHRLGTYHNTAYRLFSQYMDLLKKGYSDDGVEALFKEMNREEKKKAQIPVDGDIGLHKSELITVRDILETYMYRKLIPVQVRGSTAAAEAFSPIQRSIRQNWPDEFSLSKMEARKQDISRKTLILLFLATDGTDSDFSEEADEDELETPDDLFLSIFIRLNMMLVSCGFPQLDPRSPFDWIVLFSITSGDLWESDARLQEILNSIFLSGDETEQ